MALAIFRALTAHPYGLTMDELIAQVWHPDREPGAPEQSVYVNVWKANEIFRVMGLGLRIRGENRGRASRYRIFVRRVA